MKNMPIDDGEWIRLLFYLSVMSVSREKKNIMGLLLNVSPVFWRMNAEKETQEMHSRREKHDEPIEICP